METNTKIKDLSMFKLKRALEFDGFVVQENPENTDFKLQVLVTKKKREKITKK